ncbi:ATP-binding protein [Nocardioides sambongensis]|uniref:ATP-binding protein n=1 Tax=Nocardioides sambongensis TaxID=2589074 RepID=UPI001129F5CA|nr:ATP-binding protein [Nocardioides sambongensis]
MAVVEPPPPPDRGRLGALLDGARDRGFVGREEQLAAFADSVRGASDVRLHLVHGPGGIGKTTLLDAMARRATEGGRTIAYLDARELSCTAEAVTAAIGEDTPDVLLVDGYEVLRPSTAGSGSGCCRP